MKYLFSMLLLILSTTAFSQNYLLSGGPDGGTFKYFAQGIADIANNKAGLDFTTEPSAGSVDNIQKLNNRRADFGISYSGDLYLAREGMMFGGKKGRQYRNVHALAYLYGAPAHMVVLKKSGISSINELSFGKKIAIGKVGSGSAAAAQRLLESMRIWNKIQPQYLGFTEGAEALLEGQVDALWVFAGFPNTSVTKLASQTKIKLLPVYKEAKEKSELFKDYPFYAKIVIPANTYPGVTYEVITYQDSTLLTASKRVPQKDVEKLLQVIYTPDGLEYLVSLKSTAKDMSLNSGLTGIVTPLHRGAKKFWQNKGKIITPEQIQ
jgi:uncharacterized protein